jgi:hypothetical protein
MYTYIHILAYFQTQPHAMNFRDGPSSADLPAIISRLPANCDSDLSKDFASIVSANSTHWGVVRDYCSRCNMATALQIAAACR